MMKTESKTYISLWLDRTSEATPHWIVSRDTGNIGQPSESADSDDTTDTVRVFAEDERSDAHAFGRELAASEGLEFVARS